jgi:hypothetical protein
MGMMIQDTTTLEVLVLLNNRFGSGDAIEEMVGLQKEFEIFSSKHSLRHAFSLLNIVPLERSERKRWFEFLDRLKTYKSDKPPLSGHHRVVQAIRDDLESKNPLPIFFAVHSAKKDPRITVKTSKPIIFSLHKYVTISIPTVPGRVARKQIARKVRARRKRQQR